MRASRRTTSSPIGWLGWAVLPLQLLLVQAAAVAETACYDVSCGMSCSPQAPVGLSTLIAPGDFPAGSNTPIALVDPQFGTHFFVATQEGTILVWDTATSDMLVTPLIDLRDDVGGPVQCCGERGLLSLVLDPDFRANGHFYVFYTSDGPQGPGDLGDIVIERYTADGLTADPDTQTTLLVIDHPAGNHNGGTLAFGPDGYLYISTGDSGGSCDSNQGANGDGQTVGTLHGKILRVDVRGIDPSAGAPDDCSNSSGPYTVPSSNPYFGQANACDEVWSYGLRNPFRFTFDRATGDLYLGDVGQNKWEEINLKPASTAAPVNFGWVCREGCETSNNDESFCSVVGCPVDTGTSCEFPRASGFMDPVLCHHNGGWRSIMGGYRYRGLLVPSIYGDYFYGDNACGQIWKTTTLDPGNPAAIQSSCWASGYGGTYGFAEDRRGELYVVVGGASRVDCIHNGDGCSAVGLIVFDDGFESGNLDAWVDE